MKWNKYPESKPVYSEMCLCKGYSYDAVYQNGYLIAKLFEDKLESDWWGTGKMEESVQVTEWIYLCNLEDVLNKENSEIKGTKVKEITAYVVDGKIFKTKEEAVEWEDYFEFRSWCFTFFKNLNQSDIDLICKHWRMKRI